MSSANPGTDLVSRARLLTAGLFARVLLSILGVSLALAVALAILLSSQAASSLRAQAERAKTAAATSVARSVQAWATDRTQNAHALAAQLGATKPSASRLERTLAEYPSFIGARVYDAGGVSRVAAGAAGPPARLSGASWFTAAVTGQIRFSPLSVSAGREILSVAVPIPSAGAHRRDAVLVVSTAASELASFLTGVAPGDTGEALLVDSAHRLVLSSVAGRTPLTTKVGTTAARRGVAGATGALVYTDYQGNQAVGGYSSIPALHWGIVIKQDTSVAFAAVSRQHRLALELIILGFLGALGVALIVARVLSRPLLALQQVADAVADGELDARVLPAGVTESRRLGESFNAMVTNVEMLLGTLRTAGTEMTSSAAELSAAAEQLASATNEQSAASTQTSSTMEELSRTSSVIAEHADGVADRCVATQAALREAESGMRSSSERTMALAKQVDEISGILELIDTIAEKTAVLSLNAAIEAARAGESGAGFTVVSEEVGRLAERSKTSAAQIAEIVRATQHDASATVMAMEAGGKQMRRGLDLMDEVTTAASQVQLTTQQQRTATAQVVETMASLSQSNRQTSATTSQIAESAANLTAIAGELESSASVVESLEDDRSRAPRRSRHARPAAAAVGPSAPRWIPD